MPSYLNDYMPYSYSMKPSSSKKATSQQQARGGKLMQQVKRLTRPTSSNRSMAPRFRNVSTDTSYKVKSLSSLTPTQRSLGTATAKYLQGALTGDTGPGSMYEAAATPARQEFQNVILPGVREAYAGGGGYWGSARAGAEVSATNDLANRLAQIRADQQRTAIQGSLGITGQNWVDRLVQPQQEITETYGRSPSTNNYRNFGFRNMGRATGSAVISTNKNYYG